jgi:hypothetical protein
MKKNLLWMLAAILFCGLTVTVFTACGDDDDNNNTPSGQETPAEPSSYEVTLTFIAFKSLTPYVTYKFTYTDAQGKEYGPIAITGNERGDGLTAEEMEKFKTIYSNFVTKNVPESKYLEYTALHFTLPEFPADGSIKWETTRHKIADATAPTEAFSYVWPTVMVTVKSGNLKRYFVQVSPGVVGESNKEKWFESIIVAKDGATVPYACGRIVDGTVY